VSVVYLPCLQRRYGIRHRSDRLCCLPAACSPTACLQANLHSCGSHLQPPFSLLQRFQLTQEHMCQCGCIFASPNPNQHCRALHVSVNPFFNEVCVCNTAVFKCHVYKRPTMLSLLSGQLLALEAAWM